MRRSKRYRALLEMYDKSKIYSLDEAVTTVKKLATAKFDETVEAAFLLGIEASKGDQQVRGSVTLPKGSGKKVKVLVFATGEKAEEARAAGADYVGDDDLIQKIQKEGFLDFDVAIATPDMMKKVGRLGRILGTRGLMPNPKVGTVTNNIEATVKEFKFGKATFRNDKAGNLHTIVGKASMPEEDLKENLLAVAKAVMALRPEKAKGKFFKKLTLSTTLSTGVKVDADELTNLIK